MSKGIKIKYNNDVILDYPSDIELKLPTNGKYMESDIDIEVNRDNSGTVNITQNGTASVDGYASANVNVPNSYVAGDEGKVVSNGALVAQTSTTKTANGTYDTTTNDEVVVNVPNSYSASDEGKVVDNGTLVAQTSTTKTANGTYTTTTNNEVVVAIPEANGEVF